MCLIDLKKKDDYIYKCYQLKGSIYRKSALILLQNFKNFMSMYLN